MEKRDASYRLDLPAIEKEVGEVKFCFRQKVTSTNDWARDAASELGASEIALFLAENQTAGRGRGDHLWFSGPGSLTFSLLVPCPFALQDPQRGLFALAAGCAICAAVRPWGLEPRVKWPNDVFLEERKLAGVLIESVDQSRLVVGCGVNVNNDVGRIESATSLREHAEESLDLTNVLIALVVEINRQLSSIEEAPKKLIQQVRQYDGLAGKLGRWSTGQKTETGVAQGIAEDGSLRIRTEQGEMTVYSGSVTVLGHV